MADYMNATAGLPEQGQRVDQMGFWPGVNQGLTQQIAAPVRRNALEQADLALQSARAKFSEEQDPAAIAGRKQAIASKMATDTATIAEQPSKTKYNIDKAISMHKMLPMEEQGRLQELKQKLESSEGTAAAKVFNELADSAQQLEKVPEQMRPAAYEQLISKVKSQNPGQKIPDRFATYNPQGVRDLQLGFMARVESVGQRQKMDEKRLEEQAKKDMEAARDASHLEGVKYTANASSGASRYATDQRRESEKVVKPELENVRLNRILSSPTKKQEYAKKNGIDVGDVDEVIQAQIKTNKDEINRTTAEKLTKMRVESAWMPGSPDKGKSASDMFREELQKLSGGSPKQKYEVGKAYPDSKGKMRTFNGGDVTNESNWSK